MSSPDAFTAERALGAQRLAQYVARERCERHLRLSLFPSEARARAARYGVSFEPLSPLLSVEGISFERGMVDELRAFGRVVDMKNKPAAELVALLKAQAPGRVFYDQPTLDGRIGPWPCDGRADLVRATRGADGSLDLLVVDFKASRRETVGYRLQVAFYSRLLADMLDREGIAHTAISGAVAARDAAPEGGEFQTFDLALYLDEIERLIGAPDSDVARAARTDFVAAAYQVGPHCDGCPYNAVCLVDAAEREDLSLVPLLSAAEKSALRAEGVTTARGLAGLMAYGRGEMVPAPGRAEEVARVGARWPLAGRLPVLSQRARAALRRLDPAVEAKSYLFGSDYGSLPDESQYPDLVKVFVDAQRDYLEDRLYLIAALVVGPSGASEVVEMLPGRPGTESEREMLVSWLQKVLPAVGRVSDSPLAPLHIYLYDRRGQQALLDALARHFEALCAVPAFYDLLTSSPALTQGMVSFLAEEVRSRLNLGSVCQNLYQVARELGFKWEAGSRRFWKLFSRRVFDNLRTYEREPASGEFRPAAEKAKGAVPVEAAARFGTEIPLEYAYAAWGLLGDAGPEGAREQWRDYAGASPDDLRAFAAHRCRALRHVEECFAYKNRRVEKQPLDLGALDRVEVEPEEVPLHRSLEDFLYLEHHAGFQELMLHLSRPPGERALAWRTAVLRCESCDDPDGGGLMARFNFATPDGGEATIADLGALRFRDGDWSVLNPLVEEGRTLPAGKLIHGRLAIVGQVDAAGLTLRLLNMSFRNSAFRYGHRKIVPEAGTLYTLDEMADDLNSDKFLAACREAGRNHLYRWLTDPDVGRSPRPIRPTKLRLAARIAGLAAEAQRPGGLTEAQRRVVGDHLADRVLVVQGPPGTGKSHTLGFAVLTRALALASPTRPFRIAVATRTHAAVSIALGSIARRARLLAEVYPGEPALGLLRELRIAKVCADPGEEMPAGVERLSADGGEGLSAAAQWEELMGESLLVIGGTPGGLFNLVKRGAARGRAIDWGEKYFDLAVVDEASQMGLAEALTAAAFLREDGQFVAIGDHRQMPPILAHAWDQESRRDLRRLRPHLSIFEYLRELEFTGVGLDESFRIPAEIADFLGRRVYAADGIDFRSQNRARLARAEGLGGWLAAALAPEHPLVVVEHDEAGSQQANEFEAGLVEEIIRAASERLGLDAREGIGVVVPHRAQKALLRARLPELADSIDTVERFQGGERKLIVISATVSDRTFARLESSFLLEPRRLTVAVSRPLRKLVVIASRSVFGLIPADLDEYERGALWKYLRRECGGQALWEGEVSGHQVWVRAL